MKKKDDNSNDNSFFYKIYSKWLTTYTILAFAIYFIITFPLLLLASLGVTLLMNAILKGIKIKKIISKFKLDKTSSLNNKIKKFFISKQIIN
jgi:hypothetical protein